MIELKKISDMLTASCNESNSFFAWGADAIIHGSIENLARPTAFNNVADGSYIAIIDIVTINEGERHQAIFEPVYNFAIVIAYKSKIGDITKIRADIVDKFSTGLYTYWESHDQYKMSILDIQIRINEIEMVHDVIAVMFTGSVSHPTTKGGPIVD